MSSRNLFRPVEQGIKVRPHSDNDVTVTKYGGWSYVLCTSDWAPPRCNGKSTQRPDQGGPAVEDHHLTKQYAWDWSTQTDKHHMCGILFFKVFLIF